jgi:hypothetical protein
MPGQTASVHCQQQSKLQALKYTIRNRYGRRPSANTRTSEGVLIPHLLVEVKNVKAVGPVTQPSNTPCSLWNVLAPYFLLI